MESLPFLAGVASMFLALLGALSAAHKISERERTIAAAAALVRSEGVLARGAWAGAITVELTSAALLLFPTTRASGALLLLLLWAAYTAALVLARSGRVVADCGCSFGHHGAPGRFPLFRNGLLLLLAFWVVMATQGSLGFAGWVLAVVAAIALIALYLAADAIGSRF